MRTVAGSSGIVESGEYVRTVNEPGVILAWFCFR